MPHSISSVITSRCSVFLQRWPIGGGLEAGIAVKEVVTNRQDVLIQRKYGELFGVMQMHVGIEIKESIISLCFIYETMIQCICLYFAGTYCIWSLASQFFAASVKITHCNDLSKTVIACFFTIQSVWDLLCYYAYLLFLWSEVNILFLTIYGLENLCHCTIHSMKEYGRDRYQLEDQLNNC